MNQLLNNIKFYQLRISKINEMLEELEKALDIEKDSLLEKTIEELQAKSDILSDKFNIKLEILKKILKKNLSFALVILVISELPNILLSFFVNIFSIYASELLFLPAVLCFIINSFLEYSEEIEYIKKIEMEDRRENIEEKLRQLLKIAKNKSIVMSDLKQDIISLEMEKRKLEKSLADITKPLDLVITREENREIKR